MLIVGRRFAVSSRGLIFFWARPTSARSGTTSTKLSVPIVRRMFRALYISRSLQTMGELINAGVPMLDTLAITGDISGNRLYKRLWRERLRRP